MTAAEASAPCIHSVGGGVTVTLFTRVRCAGRRANQAQKYERSKEKYLIPKYSSYHHSLCAVDLRLGSFSQAQPPEPTSDPTTSKSNTQTQVCYRNITVVSPAKRIAGDGSVSRSLIHTPYNILTSTGIKFGYFESLVVPSSNQAKETIGDTQLGSLAAKSEYVSPMTSRKYRNDSLSSNGRLAMRQSKTTSDRSLPRVLS